MRRLVVGLLTTLTLATGLKPVHAMTVTEMEDFVSRGICSQKLNKSLELKYTDICPNYNSLTGGPANKCINDTAKQNKSIQEYNAFVDKCRSAK